MSGRGVDRRVLRRGAAVAAVALVLGAVTVLAVTGAREPASALKLLTGRAWLANTRVGTASQVDGYSGKVGAQAGAGNPGDPFEVVQRPDGAYVLDLKTGKLTRLSDATLAAAASRQLPGNPSDLQVLAGPAGTWTLDHASGVLQQVDPQSLAPSGPSIPLGAPTGAAVLDAGGNPWVPIPSRATVVEVTASGLQDHPVGSPGDVLSLQVTATGVWVVDGQAGRVQLLSGPDQAVQLPQLPAGAAPVTGSSTTSPYLPVVVGDQLLDVDTSHPAVSSTTSPGYADVQQVALVGDVAYLLAPGATQVDAVTLSPLAQQPPIPVPPGSDQLVSKDGLLFVNNADGPQAVVVGPGGSVTAVSKYTPTPAPASPGAPPSALATALPLPGQPLGPSSATPGPAGPAAPAGPASPGGTVGASQAPTPAQAPALAPVPAAPAPAAPPSPQAPGAPTLAPVSASGPTLNAAWTPPASQGSTPISSYKLIVTPQGPGATPAPTTVAAPATAGSVSGLSPNTTYCAQVQASNSAGAGALSNQQCATTTSDAPGAPGKPAVSLGTVSAGKQQATVSWSAPTTLGPFATPVASYTVTASPSGGGTPVIATSPTTSAAVALSTGATYSVTVTATNAKGNNSPASPASDPVQTAAAPGQVGAPTVNADGSQQLTASWSAVSVNDGQSVTYTVSDGGSSQTTKGTSVTFTSLTPGQAYRITVTAADAAGTGPPSAAGTGTPWGRTETAYDCYSTLWHYDFYSNQTDCGQQQGYSQVSPTGVSPYKFVGTQAPGSQPLWQVVIGRSNPTQDSVIYQFTKGGALPSPWVYGAGGGTSGYGVFAYVFTKQSDAGPGSQEFCEALNPNPSDSSHPYFNLYPMGSQPSGQSCILTFWS
jgi:hypothetical protein